MVASFSTLLSAVGRPTSRLATLTDHSPELAPLALTALRRGIDTGAILAAAAIGEVTLFVPEGWSYREVFEDGLADWEDRLDAPLPLSPMVISRQLCVTGLVAATSNHNFLPSVVGRHIHAPP